MLSIKLSENEGRAPEAVPYMPAGESWVVATVNGVPGRRRVVATREGCERLQRDLAEHLRASGAREKARPLLMFDHNVKGGADKNSLCRLCKWGNFGGVACINEHRRAEDLADGQYEEFCTWVGRKPLFLGGRCRFFGLRKPGEEDEDGDEVQAGH